MIVYQD